MLNKKIISCVVVAMLFAVNCDVATRINRLNHQQLCEDTPYASTVSKEDVVDASTVSQEDEELLNKDALNDLKLKKNLAALDSDQLVSVSDENEKLALDDVDFNGEEFEAFMNSPEMQEAMNSPEVKKMQAELEALEKENPAEFEKMMSNMLEAMQSGEGFDFGGETPAVPAATA